MGKATATKKAEAQTFPEIGEMGIPEIQEAAATLIDITSRRVSLSNEEKEANARVVEVMAKHERDYYHHDGLTVEVKKGKTKASAKYEGDSEPDSE